MSTTTAPTTARTAIAWFEIPVADLDRAQRFYESLLDARLQREPMGPQTLAVLPYAVPGVGGALVHGGPLAVPGAAAASGPLIYLNAGPRLDDAVARALAAGGRLVSERVDLPDGMGSFVHLLDTEGNRIGLHAPD